MLTLDMLRMHSAEPVAEVESFFGFPCDPLPGAMKFIVAVRKNLRSGAGQKNELR